MFYFLVCCQHLYITMCDISLIPNLYLLQQDKKGTELFEG